MLCGVLGYIEKCIHFVGVLFKAFFFKKSAYAKKYARFPYYTLLLFHQSPKEDLCHCVKQLYWECGWIKYLTVADNETVEEGAIAE